MTWWPRSIFKQDSKAQTCCSVCLFHPNNCLCSKSNYCRSDHIFSPLEIYIRPDSFPVLAVAGQSHKALPRDSLAYCGRKQMLGELLSHPVNVWDKRLWIAKYIMVISWVRRNSLMWNSSLSSNSQAVETRQEPISSSRWEPMMDPR